MALRPCGLSGLKNLTTKNTKMARRTQRIMTNKVVELAIEVHSAVSPETINLIVLCRKALRTWRKNFALLAVVKKENNRLVQVHALFPFIQDHLDVFVQRGGEFVAGEIRRNGKKGMTPVNKHRCLHLFHIGLQYGF